MRMCRAGGARTTSGCPKRGKVEILEAGSAEEGSRRSRAGWSKYPKTQERFIKEKEDGQWSLLSEGTGIMGRPVAQGIRTAKTTAIGNPLGRLLAPTATLRLESVRRRVLGVGVDEIRDDSAG